MHWWHDSFRREKTHTPTTVRQGVERLGIAIPVLSQQEAHGQLTARLRRMEAIAGDRPEASTHLAPVQASLDRVAAIIWTRDVILEDELDEATFLLASAASDLEDVSPPTAPMPQGP